MVSPQFDGSPFDGSAFDRVVDEVRPLADAFIGAGYRVYLVGGIVRDLIAGRQRSAPDIDLTTDATPAEQPGGRGYLASATSPAVVGLARHWSMRNCLRRADYTNTRAMATPAITAPTNTLAKVPNSRPENAARPIRFGHDGW